jgi:hypothetical protein
MDFTNSLANSLVEETFASTNIYGSIIINSPCWYIAALCSMWLFSLYLFYCSIHDFPCILVTEPCVSNVCHFITTVTFHSTKVRHLCFLQMRTKVMTNKMEFQDSRQLALNGMDWSIWKALKVVAESCILSITCAVKFTILARTLRWEGCTPCKFSLPFKTL